MNGQDPDLVNLIEAVQKIGRFWLPTAELTAIAAVRDPKNKDAMETAKLSLARHDARTQMADEVIAEIRRYWPSQVRVKS